MSLSLGLLPRPLLQFRRRPTGLAACWSAGSSRRRVYWYRFTDTETDLAAASAARSPRQTMDDARPVRFVFVSCQNANQGAQNAYRRMIFEDERAAEAERLGFVLHLGDFIYEIVWYPEDRPQGMYDRRIRDIVRYPHGEKIRDFHIPTTVDDYRAVYRAYLHDPDLQDARARWPFVNMWDNHEFSWLGWQSLQKIRRKNAPGADAQSRRQPGVLRISAGADGTNRAGRRSIASIRRTWSMRRLHALTSMAWARTEQSCRHRQPQGLPRVALGSQCRADHHRPAQLSLRRAYRPREANRLLERRLSRIDAGRSDGNPGRRPYL